MGRGFLGDDQVRRVREAVDLAQLISEFTPLRRAGANFIGCCPFHQERSPSFHVYADGHYHCYGCKAHGDAITFLREKENIEFTDAVELLARRAGIQLEWREGQGGGPERGERDELLRICEFAAAFYETCLHEDPSAAEARAYLAGRRLREDTIRRFRLGWAPGRGALVEAAKRKGMDVRLLAKLDLAVERQGRLADRFWERVTFPICDRFGHPLAFSARLLPAAERAAKEAGTGVGKYVNNTDTPLYHKGSAVFNLHHARTACRDKGRLIVMEGPTDVMAADQAGWHECVAVLGTALTGEHARQLGTLVGRDGRLVVLLDGDAAGQSNSLRAVKTCLGAGVPVKVAVLPDELDPAELLAEGGERPAAEAAAVFEGVLERARDGVDHLLRMIAPQPHALDQRERLAALDKVLEALRVLPDRELRELHAHDAATWFDLDPAQVQRRLAGSLPEPAAGAAPAQDDAPALDPAREAILHLLVQEPALRAAAADQHGLEPSHFPGPWQALAGALLLDGGADLHALAALPACREHRTLSEQLHGWASTPLAQRVPAVGDPAEALAQAARRLRQAALRDRQHQIKLAMNEALRTGDSAQVRALGEEQLRLARELRGSI